MFFGYNVARLVDFFVHSAYNESEKSLVLFCLYGFLFVHEMVLCK